jgi:hypothetical protein
MMMKSLIFKGNNMVPSTRGSGVGSNYLYEGVGIAGRTTSALNPGNVVLHAIRTPS